MLAEAIPETIPPRSRIGKYEIVHRIAYGGMAEIYLARVSGIQGFEKYVVLKRILPQYAAREDFLSMFLQEARLAATLDQANIAHVYDIGELGGSYFYTMEYLHGEDLRKIMSALGRSNGRLPLSYAVGIAAAVARGLHYAHEKRGQDGRPLGIVHRDVSPSNVVVTFDGDVKLVDFGIAKITSDPDLTSGQGLKGKVAYMSPEQLRAQPVDRRSDVFSLGVVLYEITTHRRMFAGKSVPEIMRALTDEDIARPTAVEEDYPRDLETIVLRALAREPEERYPSARDLQRDLEAFARAQGVDNSSAALAEWMVRLFGPRPEPWLASAAEGTPTSGAGRPTRQPDQSARVVSPSSPAGSAPVGSALRGSPSVPREGDAFPTRVVSRQDAIALPAGAFPAASPAPTSAPAPPSAATAAPTDSVTARSRRWTLARALAVGVLATGLAAVIAATLTHVGGPKEPVSREAKAANGAPILVVVTESGKVALDPPHPLASPGSDEGIARQPRARAPEPADRDEPAPAPPPRAVVRSRHLGKPSRAPAAPAGPAPTTFSASLARHETELRACFAADGNRSSEASAIVFHFKVLVDGRVESVSVLPEAMGATPLGRCLAKVGAGTVFPRQPEPIGFRIPLSLRVRTSGSGHHP